MGNDKLNPDETQSIIDQGESYEKLMSKLPNTITLFEYCEELILDGLKKGFIIEISEDFPTEDMQKTAAFIISNSPQVDENQKIVFLDGLYKQSFKSEKKPTFRDLEFKEKRRY